MLFEHNYFDGEEVWSCKKLRINKSKIKSYLGHVNSGKESCSNSKVAVVSLARNCEKNLQKSIDQVKKIQSKDFKFFIYENDSVDKTKEILTKNQSDKITVSLNTDQSPHLNDRSRARTHNLARYRNVCSNWVKKNCPDFDYVIVLDLDPDLGFSVNGIYNSISWLNKIPKAGGMGSYSLSMNKSTFIHYDTFAIRARTWYVSTVYRQEEKFFSNFHPKIGSNPIFLYSCFGGLAVYKMEAFKYGKYDGSIGCEHVLFHKGMKDKGYDMYLNPSSLFFAINK